MRKSSIIWVASLALSCLLVVRLGVMFAHLPMQVEPNWFTIIPALASFAAFVGLTVRKESAPASSVANEQVKPIADDARPLVQRVS
jgi:hypothetical protein